MHNIVPATKVGELTSRLQSYLAAHPDSAEIEVGVRPFTHNSRVLGFGLWDSTSTTNSPRPWIEFADIEFRLHDGPEAAPGSRWPLGPYHRIRRDVVSATPIAFGMFFTHEHGKLVSIEASDFEQAWYGNSLWCPLKRSFDFPLMTVVAPMGGSTIHVFFVRVRVEDGEITNESLRQVSEAAKQYGQRAQANRSRKVREHIRPSLEELDHLEGWPDDWRNQLCETLPMTNPRIVEGGIGGPLLYSLATACDFASAFNAFGLALK